MTDKGELIATCPYVKCNQVIFRKTRLDITTEKPDIIEFVTKCPHCRNSVRIKIEAIIRTEPINL